MSEARDWDEYLAWTRGASPGEYRLTEELAWRRLEDARLRRSVEQFEILPPRENPLQGEVDPSRPVGGSDASQLEDEDGRHPDWSF